MHNNTRELNIIMKSWKLARVFGIDIELHWTTLLFIVLLVILSPMIALVLALLFIIISIHELSHSLVAKRKGLEVKKIILLPIGGMAVMDETSLKPEAEFYMAFAGPAVNFIMAVIVLIWTQLLGIPLYSLNVWNAMMNGQIQIQWIGFINSSLFWLNWLLGTFNLFVPAIPMDGGRVFRAFLAMFMDYVKATRIAAIVSKIITAIMFIISVVTLNLILMLISIFIYLGASAEINQAINYVYLPKINLRSIMKRRAIRVKPQSKVSSVIKTMAKRNVTQVFVGDPFHTITIDDLENVDPERTAGEIARPIRGVSLKKPESIIKSFAVQNVEILPVKEKNKVVGFISLADLETAIRIAKLLK